MSRNYVGFSRLKVTGQMRDDFRASLRYKGVRRDVAIRRLRAAIECLQESGWVRGTLQDGKGRVCAVGALDRADSRFPTGGFNRVPLENALRHLIPRYNEWVEPIQVIRFNDGMARDKRDVIALFDTAIETLEESK